MDGNWSPTSWRSMPIKQQPIYTDPEAVEAVMSDLRRLPPLVTPSEVLDLRSQLAEVALGKRFLLQGGDCAERFQDCSSDSIEKKLRILLQMSLVLTWGARVPTLRVARMAGQFAKPRSKDTEFVDGVEYTAFRGDNVNSFDTTARSPDPARMLSGYFHSAATLNYARAVLASGLGDLHASASWDLDCVTDAENRAQYKEMLDRILSALDFMRVCGAGEEAALKVASVFMSHEGLHLAYEEALTRPSRSIAPNAALLSAPPSASGAAAIPGSPSSESSRANSVPYFNLGTHFLWIGDRTRQLDHGHVEYFRGIENPVGIKAGPTSSPQELVEVIQRLWPKPSAAPGKIVIITRMGAGAVKDKLPALIKAVQDANLDSPVVWVSDPMHGNTRVSSNGYKTRNFDDILCELKYTFEVHHECQSRLGGVHFELTGENVTECTGGPQNLLEADLPLRYTTYCDPRLNYAQGMELAFLIAVYLADERSRGDNLAKTPARLAKGRGFSPTLRSSPEGVADSVPTL